MTKPHIEFAHKLWKDHLQTDDHVIDATCGNGHDTLFLLSLLPKGKVYGIDIQENAVFKTKNRCQDFHSLELYQISHEKIDLIHLLKPPSLIVYNLGYLPGSDKAVTTKTSSTLISLKKSLAMIKDQGAVCITTYPGHPEGEKEDKKILNFLSDLGKSFEISRHDWIQKKQSPKVFWIKKIDRN